MSQDFHGVFVPTEQAQVTMQKLIEESLDALRTNWEGIASPGSPSPSQWFSDTTNNKLRIRKQDGTDWEDIYDFGTSEVVLAAQQVEATHISDAARKPSLISGESISPSSCSIQAQFSTVSLFGVPSEFFPLFTTPTATTGVGVLTSGTQTTLLSSKIYVPSNAGTLYAMLYLVTCSAQFVVGALTSTNTGIVTGPGWSSVIFKDLSTLSGWQDIQVQATSSVGSSPWGGIGGISFRWEV
jgi:hypothetical protein